MAELRMFSIQDIKAEPVAWLREPYSLRQDLDNSRRSRRGEDYNGSRDCHRRC